VSQSGDTDDVPDLSLIVEGLQAAWMSEHGDDGEVKHTGKLHDIYVPPASSESSETIIMRRPGAEPIAPPIETPTPEVPPPAHEPEPVLQETAQPVAEQVIEPTPEPVIDMVMEQVASEPEPPKVVAEPEKTNPQASRIRPVPSSQPARNAPVGSSISPEDILQDARAAFSHGVLDESLDRYLDLISRNRLIESVIEDLESMTSTHGEQSDIWQALGDAYTRRNLLDQALSAYLKAEELLK
jgi:hypothetical protein